MTGSNKKKMLMKHQYTREIADCTSVAVAGRGRGELGATAGLACYSQSRKPVSLS